MKRLFSLCALIASPLVVCSVAAAAAPAVDSAIINTRIFNDDPGSVLTTVNNYPTLVSIRDEMLDGTGFANLHNFRLSEDAGVSEAEFANADRFSFFSDLTLTGIGEGEAGLSVAPWWSQDVDGRFNVRSTDGEIACFGGRLPFYSFTSDQGLAYVKGTTVRLGVVYMPNALSMASPATIQYFYDDGTQYMSPVIPFDEGNPAEDPPHGLWGMLNDARVGGYVQAFLQAGNPDTSFQATFENMEFIPGPGTAFAAAVAAIPALRRRRRR